MLPTRRCLVLIAFFRLLAPWAPAAAAGPSAPATLLGKPVQASDGEALRDEVLSALVARYAKARRIAATRAEIDAYLSLMDRTLRKDLEQAQARRVELERQLTDAALSDAQRQALRKELAEATETAQSIGSMSALAADPADAEARREVAAAFIVQWKLNRALYRQYGGRIIYQQGGPEPLDALHRFLRERQAAGDFSIADPALAEAFWRYFRDDGLHTLYPRGSREEAQAFAVPLWQAR